MSWWTEDGSTHLHACLPHADAAGLVKLIEAHLEEDRRATRHRRDVRTPEQRRANAFVALVAAHHERQASPTIGGDRPRIVVHLDHDRLRQRAEGAGVLETGEPLAAGDLRRLCRDADILPAVLGTDSDVLDLGHTARLATPAVRTALDLRDGGCIFPHCDLPPSRCQAHHILPWWAGGATDRTNLALLCPTHHALVEPRGTDGMPTRDQWHVVIDPHTHKPACIPPRE